jgi:hypothetical protein
MSKMRGPLAALGCVALFTVGCGQKASDEDYDDVATAVGALVANDSGGEIGSMEDAEAAALGESDLTQMGSGGFQGTRAGLTYEYQLTCSDASGAVLEACNSTTDSATLSVSWSGELTLPRYQGSISRTGNWTLSGLQSPTAEFNGHGTFNVESSFQALFRDVERSFLLDYDGDYQGVRWRRSDKRPEAGVIRYTVHAERTRERGNREVEVELDVEVVITFDGDGTAELTIDSERNYSLDIERGTVSK